MKMIKIVEKDCPCLNKIDEYAGEVETLGWGEGTVIECDCGSRYRKGKATWIKIHWREVGT